MTSSIEKKGDILVVDDQDTNRLLLRVMLEKEGFKVTECDSGIECLSICRQSMPDMVLLDIMMPGMDGFEVCETLRKDFTSDQLPVILVTACTDGADVKRGIDVGANDYITKPLDRSILLARVDNQLSVAKSYQKIREQQAIIANSLELQKSIGDALDQAIFVSDSDGSIVYVNARGLSYCGEKEPKTVLSSAELLFSGKLSDLMNRATENIGNDPSCIVESETRLQYPSDRYIQFKSYPVGSGENGQGLRIWSFRDITKMREMERNLSQQVKMDTVSMFAIGVAHNFNNLLGSILGASEILDRITSDNQTAQRCIRILQRAVSSGQGLTEKMSTLVKHDVLSNSDLNQDLHIVLHDVVEHFSNRDGCGIQFHLSIDKSLPKIAMERTNLRDIVANVVENALDAVDGAGSVWISAGLDQDSEKICLKVWDDGIGMSQEVQDRLFEPFFSTKNLDTQNGMSMVGNGLGMWNVYNLVKGADGDITVKSAPNSGTEVLIQLPIAEANDNSPLQTSS